jgi:hypothetical protein
VITGSRHLLVLVVCGVGRLVLMLRRLVDREHDRAVSADAISAPVMVPSRGLMPNQNGPRAASGPGTLTFEQETLGKRVKTFKRLLLGLCDFVYGPSGDQDEDIEKVKEFARPPPGAGILTYACWAPRLPNGVAGGRS